MSQSTTPIEVLEQNVVWERTEQGLMSPMEQGFGLRIVDCGDDRGLTPDYYAKRVEFLGSDVNPGRYYGAASGVAIAALITFAAEYGDKAVTRFVGDYSSEGFVDFASNLSDRAHRQHRVELNQHSSAHKEQNATELGNHKTVEDPLDCKFATALGAVLLGANKEWQISEAKNILIETGTDLPIAAAAEGITILQQHIPENFGIHRGALHHAQTRSGRHTPVAIHKGHHAANDQAALVVDLAGYRSNANRHNERQLYRYHHTPGLASELLPKLMPEIKLDPIILEATGLLLATSTRLALSGAETPAALKIEVIPAEYSQVA